MIYTEYPNDEMILDIIKNYINNSIYPYAIMIDGQWGSGKTFFVKNKLIKELSKYIKGNSQKYDQIIYVSLYGISEINTIPTRIILNINEHHKLKKTIPFIKDIFKATGKAFNAVIAVSNNFSNKFADNYSSKLSRDMDIVLKTLFFSISETFEG